MSPSTPIESRALLLSLIERMRSAGSWTGETHIQKCVYFINILFGVDLGHRFVMYKHGPYSFELRDELSAMRTRTMLTVEPRAPYGSSFNVGPASERLMGSHLELIGEHASALNFVSEKLSTRHVAELERLSAAAYVKRSDPQLDLERWAQALHGMKPHVSLESAKAALQEVAQLASQAETIAK